MENKLEYILSAATHYDNGIVYKNQPKNIGKGFVICGRRHKNCNEIFQIISKKSCFQYEETKGFITNTNRFINRKEAYQIAFNSNQIIGPNKKYPTNEIGLTSEDLY